MKLSYYKYEQRLLPKLGFNPSLAVLPPSLAKRLNKNVKKRSKGAIYVASFKRSAAMCWVGGLKQRIYQQVPSDTSTIAFLDANFNVLANRTLAGQGVDMRFSEKGGQLYLDGRDHYGHSWFLKQLDFEEREGGLQAILDGASLSDSRNLKFDRESLLGSDRDGVHREEQREDQRREALSFLDQHEAHAANLGLFTWQNLSEVLWWIDESFQIRTSLPETETNSMTMSGRTWYRNSVHPIELVHEQAYLGILHDHKSKGLHGYKWGSEYSFRFMLFENKPPWRTRSLSDWFCIPSASSKHRNQCEVVQFIMGLIVDPRDPNSVLIPYGVADCEPAVLRLPIAAIMTSLTPLATAGHRQD